MAARFQESARNNGFDSTERWQMVGVGFIKEVVLVDGAGLSLVSTAPAVASVFEAPGRSTAHRRQIFVTGLVKGSAEIQARSGTSVRARLKVGVKDMKVIRTAFHFVRDSAARPHVTSRRRARPDGTFDAVAAQADADAILTTMNNIYFPQTNILFSRASVQEVTVGRDLGRTVLDASGSSRDEWGHVTGLGDTTADFRIFFVWRLEQAGTSGDEDALTETPGPNCLIEDRAGRDLAETLAHEAGHHMGLDDVNTQGFLMYKHTDTRGRKIPRRHADRMNP